jgi:hypothetical protein
MIDVSYSTVKQLWSPITLRNPEDGGDMFSERGRYKFPEDTYD